jgi:hypothetical protein
MSHIKDIMLIIWLSETSAHYIFHYLLTRTERPNLLIRVRKEVPFSTRYRSPGRSLCRWHRNPIPDL